MKIDRKNKEGNEKEGENGVGECIDEKLNRDEEEKEEEDDEKSNRGSTYQDTTIYETRTMLTTKRHETIAQGNAKVYKYIHKWRNARQYTMVGAPVLHEYNIPIYSHNI